MACWPEPVTAAIVAAAPAWFVNDIVAVVALPAAAVTLNVPAVWFAVSVPVATPEAFVVIVRGLGSALAPEAGEVTVTETPGTGLPYASTTVAPIEANAAPTVTVWPVPEVHVTVAGAPAAFERPNWTLAEPTDAATL